MASQKGPLWWAAHHRNHHRFSDTDRDVHSPRRGFWWSHVGWILCDKYNEADRNQIRDFAKFPELRFIDRHDWIGPWTLGAACFLIGGWSGLLIGFFASTVLLWHVTFTVNSVAHVMGRRAYDTDDTSRNTLLVALATGGEGWHNNHHRYPWAARQGFRWWQIDTTYYVSARAELDRHRPRPAAGARDRSSRKRASPRLDVELRVLLGRTRRRDRPSTPDGPGGGNPNSSSSRGVDDSTKLHPRRVRRVRLDGVEPDPVGPRDLVADVQEVTGDSRAG